MRAVIQRVLNASVAVDEKTVGSIKNGILVLLGISPEDTEKDIKWLADKILGLRIFEDEQEKMNKSLLDINGELLIISQFTLYGDCRKGKRPSFTLSAKPELAKKMYDKFVNYIINNYDIKVETGIFQADMKVSLVNDGPVTFMLDSTKLF
ncbi:D-aminoacyl-tRNA deacylase [Tepiditoga spiralis]|uniref:D-aminoacyl-tRNA deacylase n=1 Tax=Tepiditoga spiralis TaxID=2108365 RepID=A0A7G1G8T1_9BACT|nr:D-aminoacyl-tRNA deacylase [Tepiditoga spiralis]BBE31377.1 D-aminoacyl-tRNA deacylase [Tepiditoga spiralis]